MKRLPTKSVAIILIIFGLGFISKFLLEEYKINQSSKEITNAIMKYETSYELKSSSISDEKTTNNELPKIVDTTTKPYVETKGVLTIEKIGLKAPVTMGVEDYKLKSHAGLYPSLGTPDQSDVIAIAAHSSWTTKCAHCFFEKLEDLSIGDLIYLNYENIEYSYKIVEVTAYDSPDETRYFYPNDNGNHKLILVTCTNGDSKVRTYVVAEEV